MSGLPTRVAGLPWHTSAATAATGRATIPTTRLEASPPRSNKDFMIGSMPEKVDRFIPPPHPSRANQATMPAKESPR